MRQLLLVVAAVALLAAACGGESSGGLVVDDARIGQPTGPNAALYFVVNNDQDAADRLIGASTDAASAVELHETTMSDDGTMGMQPVDGLDVPADGTLTLEPGGLHLMLIDADRMDVGATVMVTLEWETAGDMTIEAEVVDPADAMGDHDMEMDENGDG